MPVSTFMYTLHISLHTMQLFTATVIGVTETHSSGASSLFGYSVDYHLIDSPCFQAEEGAPDDIAGTSKFIFNRDENTKL